MVELQLLVGLLVWPFRLRTLADHFLPGHAVRKSGVGLANAAVATDHGQEPLPGFAASDGFRL